MTDAPLTPGAVVAGTGRPEPPVLAGLTPLQALDGRGLEAIHRLYLRDLRAVGALMGDIRAGLADPAALAPAIRGMPMAENLALFGTACGAQCRALTVHHRLEDEGLFPAVAAAAGVSFAPLLARLAAEHRVIHDLIEDLAAAAAALAADTRPALFDACAQAFDRLDAVVRSHFRYEETRLAAPLGYYGIGV